MHVAVNILLIWQETQIIQPMVANSTLLAIKNLLISYFSYIYYYKYIYKG